MSINRVNITGNLTREPDYKVTPGGTQVLRIGVAVNDRRYNQREAKWEDAPNFIDCVIFGKRAESLAQFLQKGAKVAIEGKLRWSSWETQDGQRRSKVEVAVDDLEFMSTRNAGAPQAGAMGGLGGPTASIPPASSAPSQEADTAQAASSAAPEGTDSGDSFYDESIPF